MWLYGMCVLVAIMVLVGGATRLTDSGLSITEWKPVTGAVPPLGVEAWQAEFEKYKQIPEYQLINSGMSLAEFKTIYWWEWGHRLLGRVIGIAFLVPFVWFLATGRVRGRLAILLGGLFLLGGAQGALGWFMVQSGLVDRVDVSQYRLAAHLGLAVLLFALMLLLALSLRTGPVPASGPVSRPLATGAAILTVAVYGQIILGAFVAGLDAGYAYPDWPLMQGQIVPDGYFSATPRLRDLFESIAAVQFNHRMGAYLLLIGAAGLFWAARGTTLSRPALIVLLAITGQAVLGILTLRLHMPLVVALAHQLGSLFVLSAALWCAVRARWAAYSGMRSVPVSKSSGRAGRSTVAASAG